MAPHSRPQRTARLALAIGLIFPAAVAIGADTTSRKDLEAPTVEVVGTTPVTGLGTPVEQVPANVQAVTGDQIREQQSINLPEFMNRSMPSVSVSEIQNNPFQQNVNYRGFEASPLLGAPQGLSVFQDGVRINEPFGDIVNWDLIPLPAVSTMAIVPGSNPVFGLNTLGGAIEIRTKNGRQFPGLEVEAYGGSWGRRAADLAWGGAGENMDYFVAANWFDEDGWRDYSPTHVKQLFAKVGHQTADTRIDFSITYGDTNLTGNGVTPESMLQQRREQIYTYPDNTQNQMTLLNLSASHWLNDQVLLSGLVYHRLNHTKTLNGDANDDFEGDPALDGDAGANGGAGFNTATAVSNRTKTDQTGDGVGLQGSWVLDKNTLAVGSTYDYSKSEFDQSSQLGVFRSASDRSVLETDPDEVENSLKGRTQTVSLYATDTWNVTETVAATVSGRYNHTTVKTTDRLNTTPPNLDGDFTYDKFNPAVGLTWQLTPALGTYAGWNQGSRAPSPIELGCADPNNPCTLPNALASDPYLKQVVTQTIEAGFRGRLSPSVAWNAGVYRSINKDDILFVGTTTSAGYFTNFGKTRRQGAELGLDGETGRMRWSVNYSYVQATFQSSACLLSENNSSAGSSAACASPDDNLILVSPGNKMPGIPEHQLKLIGDYRITDKWLLGGMMVAFSDQYARGNENNQHQAGTFNGEDYLGSGKVPGYAIFNLNTRYKVTSNWEVFGRIDNVFDKEYSTGAILAENSFNAAGAFQTNSDDWTSETFYAPGAPRAFWVGVKYTMGQPKK
ncbi:MAG TPA: TonB-dependent receptor [Burkholderiales bacterium]|nr:TonB-dependent receptor [Burkholderiales bacterium]